MRNYCELKFNLVNRNNFTGDKKWVINYLYTVRVINTIKLIKAI